MPIANERRKTTWPLKIHALFIGYFIKEFSNVNTLFIAIKMTHLTHIKIHFVDTIKHITQINK